MKQLNGTGRIYNMSKGTILYVGGFELPDKNAAAHRVLSNGKIFRELGYKVVFIDVDKSLQYDSDISDTKKYVQGFECWSISYPKSKKEWLKYLTSIDFMDLMIEKYIDLKIVVAYNYPAFALRNLNKYCSSKNIKTIGDCTEWYSIRGENIIFKIIKGLDSFYRMRVIQKKLNGMIVISKYLEEYYKRKTKLVRIPPLVDINERKWNFKNTYVQESVKKKNLIKLIYSGNPGRNKDKINYLIKALYTYNQHRNYILQIIGITKEQYIQDYPEHFNILDSLDDKIIFLGKLSHNQSLEYLHESDFSIFIRDNNRLTKAGFPTKFVESISCGIPVITTLVGDLEDYLINGKNGVIIKNPQKSNNELKNVLEMDIEDVKDMKNYCEKNNQFHYSYFINRMDKFLQFDENMVEG